MKRGSSHLKVRTLYMSRLVATPNIVSARARSLLITNGKIPSQIVMTGIPAALEYSLHFVPCLSMKR